MIVCDASVVLQILLRMPAAKAVEDRLRTPGEEMHAPHLIDLEILHVLRRYAATYPANDADYRRAVVEWLAFPVSRHSHDVYASRIWALRHNLSAYDAAYVALAEGLRAPLLTRDQHLFGSTGHRAQIEYLA